MKKPYNTTQLSPDLEFERHIFHRDQFAHYLRWTYVLKQLSLNMKVLDIGCGTGNLAEVMYRNRYKGKKYLGLDIRKQTIENNKIKFSNINWIEFRQQDLCDKFDVGNDWDYICSFEVVEHIGKQNIDKYLSNIYNAMNDKTIFLISTPNYDEKVGAANNHIYDSRDGRGISVQEFTHKELETSFTKYFTIEKKYGTFASQRDYKKLMNDWQTKMFDTLSEYFDSNLMSVIMAPMFPEQSRNCLWVLKKK